MRLYSITNMYTSGIHAGIQTAHLVHEMFNEASFDPSGREADVLWDWSRSHKTIIVLNGGYHSNISTVANKLKLLGLSLGLPVGSFRESLEALNGAMTATGIVVPEKIYDYKESFDSEGCLKSNGSLNYIEHELYDLIKFFPLAK